MGSATPFCFQYRGSTWALSHELGLSMFVLEGISSGTTDCPNTRCAKELQKQSMRTELEKGDAEQVKVLYKKQHNFLCLLLPFICSHLLQVLRNNGASWPWLACEGKVNSLILLQLLWRWQKWSGSGKFAWTFQCKEASEIQKYRFGHRMTRV